MVLPNVHWGSEVRAAADDLKSFCYANVPRHVEVVDNMFAG